MVLLYSPKLILKSTPSHRVIFCSFHYIAGHNTNYSRNHVIFAMSTGAYITLDIVIIIVNFV